MRRRTLGIRLPVALTGLALGVVACVDIPDNMRAQFAPAGPSDRTNYIPGRHGSAPPPTIDPMLPWDSGAAPVVAPPVVDAAAPAPAPAPADLDASADGGLV